MHGSSKNQVVTLSISERSPVAARWRSGLAAVLVWVVALAGCSGKSPECTGTDAHIALQSLFTEQAARILQHYAFDQADPMKMVSMGAALDLGLADDGVTLMLSSEDAAKIKWSFETAEVTARIGGARSCVGRVTYSRGQFVDQFPIRFELRYTSAGEIDVALLN